MGVTQINQSIIKNAPHPNAAKLWIEWSLSEEGQTLLAAQGYATVRKGMKIAEPEASLEGVKFLPRDDDPETSRSSAIAPSAGRKFSSRPRSNVCCGARS